MQKKLLVIFAIALAVVAVPVLRNVAGGGNSVEVQIEALAPRSIQASVLASGHLVHEEEVKLSTEVIGRVTGIYVEEGDRVTNGQLLLQIDDEIYRAAVDQNEATVRMQEIAIQRQQMWAENLKTKWDRQQELHERNLIDDDSFEVATNEWGVAEIDLRSSRESLSQAIAQLEQAEDRLSKTRVVSPIDGTVTSLDIKVAEGAQGLGFAVKIRLEKTNGIVLRPGMSCRAEIFTEIAEGLLAVPIQAILVDEDRNANRTTYRVFVHEDRKARQVEVRVGLSDDAWQAVTGGLNEGDEVIIGPDRVLRNLGSGDNVTVLSSD